MKQTITLPNASQPSTPFRPGISPASPPPRSRVQAPAPPKGARLKIESAAVKQTPFPKAQHRRTIPPTEAGRPSGVLSPDFLSGIQTICETSTKTGAGFWRPGPVFSLAILGQMGYTQSMK